MEDEKEREERVAIFEEYMGDLYRRMDRARECQQNGDYEHAAGLMKPCIDFWTEKFKQGFLQGDDERKLFNFDSLFEKVLFYIREKPEYEVVHFTHDFSNIFYTYGNMLFDLKNFDEAEEVLKEAMKWNPVSTRNAFEHAEIFKELKDFDKYFELTLEIFKIAYTPEQLGRCYRNLGYCFIEKGLLDVALECYSLSYQVDHSEHGKEIACNELGYIESKIGSEITLCTDHLKEYAEKYGFPYGPDRDIVWLAYYRGKDFFEKKEYDDAKYFLKIAYNLVPFDDVKEMLDKINERNIGRNKGPVAN